MDSHQCFRYLNGENAECGIFKVRQRNRHRPKIRRSPAQVIFAHKQGKEGHSVVQLSELGLVELTRRRRGRSLFEIFENHTKKIFFVLKNKQWEKVQAADINF